MPDFQKKIDKWQPNSVTDRRLSLSLWFLIIYNMAKITQLAKKSLKIYSYKPFFSGLKT